MSRTKDNDSPATAPVWKLQVLGGLILRSAGGAMVELPTRKSALLLAYLAMPAGTAHARDRLADLLWPSSGQDQARGSLRHALAALRKLLGGNAIEGARDMVKLRPGVVVVDLDVVADLAEGRAAPSVSGTPATGTFLDGIATDGDAIGEWLTFERTRCRALQQVALQRTVDTLSTAERHTDAIAAAERLVALDPLREQSHRTIMQALVHAGERSKALAQFKRLEDVLMSDLGVAPSTQSTALANEIRQAASPVSSNVNAASAPGASHPRQSANDRSAGHITIAVLPFQCLSDGGDLAAYADGFSSELVTGLSRAPEFSVIAWQSSAQVSGRAGDAVQSVADLNAGYGLTGTLRLVDGRIRIGAQLIAAASRTWIWAERYDLEMSEAVSAQDDIIAGIMGAVDAGVRRSERESARSRPIVDLDAWSLYHRGMWHMYRFSRDDVVAAEQLFATAIEKDASAAGPHAGLAYASIVRVLWRFSDNLRLVLDEGLRHARDALARDEHDANVHTVLGRLLVMAGQAQRGIEHLERAIELNPSHAHAHYGLGQALYVAGRPTAALVALATALRLSPKDPLASVFLTITAFCHLMLDDLSAAETAARRARNMLSKETWSRLALAATLQIKGDVSGARSAVAEAREIEPSLTMSTFAPLVQHIPPAMRDRVLSALAVAGLPPS